MSTESDISGLVPDDLEFLVSLTYNGAPLDLSTVQGVTAYLKPYANSPDSEAKTYTSGNGLTVTDSPNGKITWDIPHGDTPGMTWYRFTVTDGSNRLKTALRGHLEQEDA